MSAPAALAPEALPTLLTSRPRPDHGAKETVKAQSPQALPEKYEVRVRNTFIDTSAERSPSLERFYREREVSTCPSAHIGRLRDLFQEAEAGIEAEGDLGAARQPRAAAEMYGSLTLPTGPQAELGGAAAAEPGTPPVLVLSLVDALCPPPPLHEPGALAGVERCAGGCGGLACAYEALGDVLYDGQQLSWSELLPEHSFAAYSYMAEEQAMHAEYSGGIVEATAAPGMFYPSVHMDLEAAPAPPDRPAPGSAELPSTGSAGHAEGHCKPCAFYHTVGCARDLACHFCHLCEVGEKKRRRKEKLGARRAAHKLRQAQRQAPEAVEGDWKALMAAK